MCALTPRMRHRQGLVERRFYVERSVTTAFWAASMKLFLIYGELFSDAFTVQLHPMLNPYRKMQKRYDK